MTAQILHMRDYKTREEREAEISRLGLATVTEALMPQDDENYRAYREAYCPSNYQTPPKDPA